MIGKLFRRYKQGGRTISAKDLNKRAHILEAVAKATMPNGMYDSTGIHSRTQVRPKIITLIRSAKIQSSGIQTTYLQCKLLDKNDAEEGSVINVYMRSYVGTAALDLIVGVWPEFNTGDIIAVRLDLNGTWYFDGIVDESTVC